MLGAQLDVVKSDSSVPEIEIRLKVDPGSIRNRGKRDLFKYPPIHILDRPVVEASVRSNLEDVRRRGDGAESLRIPLVENVLHNL